MSTIFLVFFLGLSLVSEPLSEPAFLRLGVALAPPSLSESDSTARFFFSPISGSEALEPDLERLFDLDLLRDFDFECLEPDLERLLDLPLASASSIISPGELDLLSWASDLAAGLLDFDEVLPDLDLDFLLFGLALAADLDRDLLLATDFGVCDLDLGLCDLDFGLADLDFGVTDLDFGVTDLDFGL